LVVPWCIDAVVKEQDPMAFPVIDLGSFAQIVWTYELSRAMAIKIMVCGVIKRTRNSKRLDIKTSNSIHDTTEI
jgi:hypothetical protein